MKTIIITANTSWYLYNFRKNTILSLADCDYRVVTIAPTDEYSEKLLALGCEFYPIAIDQKGTNPINDFRTFISFYRIYRKQKASVVLNFTPKNNIYSTLAANFLGIKVINNIAGLGTIFMNENITSKIVLFLYKISQPKANKIFFQNEEDRQLFIQKKIAPASLTDRIPGSGVDLNRFSLSPTRDDNRVSFLLVSRMLFDKGIEYYVKAARILKAKYGERIEFRLLGFLDVKNPSAVSKKQMQTWVNEGIVTYLGISDNVENEIKLADCIVLPSFYREGVPRSLLEAAAMGKPIVTTDNVGCRDTVSDGVNGYLCTPRSVTSLTKKLDTMIAMSHEQRIRMGIQSRKKVESEFDEQIVINKYIAAISDCL